MNRTAATDPKRPSTDAGRPHPIGRCFEPSDRSWAALRPAVVGGALASWLSERGSVTRRLRVGCGRLQLILLRQRGACPLPDELALLGLRKGRYAWVREVLLLADGRPVLYAHSVARFASLRSAWRPLLRVGFRPVGDAIFDRPATRRGPIRVRHLSRGHRLHRAAEHALASAEGLGAMQLPALWARRSPFVHSGEALWITEVFLPEIERIGKHRMR
jgi:chorismate lyase